MICFLKRCVPDTRSLCVFFCSSHCTDRCAAGLTPTVGGRFHRGEYTVEVAINDYLDIYCPHYESGAGATLEKYVLFMVNYDGYTTCDHRRRGFKRWDEKFQLFTPFSLGFEFRPGHEYYYISSPHLNQAGKPCLKLKVYVKPTNDSIYESPEPFLTDDTTGGGVTLEPRLFLPAVALVTLGFLLSSL
ncbi:hypothetical protein WMY93_024606 [Mugilogobius chulae]|uniref:Ephrin RBD domain-containing protein n=1 Tax=Mugilogobius chulae TaxID=88201 RepID=A0AAW0N047_9GOBI